MIIPNITIEQLLEREYKNIYYSSTAQMESVESYMHKYERDKLVPGFTMSARTRPLVISKLDTYMRERTALIRSKRLIDEFKVWLLENAQMFNP